MNKFTTLSSPQRGYSDPKEKIHEMGLRTNEVSEAISDGIALPNQPFGTGNSIGRPPLERPMSSLRPPRNDGRRVKFQTLGCRLNQYETQAIREQFLSAGYCETENDQEADLLVLNTCTVTNESDKENRYLIRRFHRENPDAKIVVTGCYVERNEFEIKSLPGVTLTVLNRQKAQLFNLFESCTSLTFAPIELPSKRTYTPLTISEFEGKTRAFIKVQDGCNHACSFCKVVLVRGPARSRAIEDVVEEAKRLCDQGFKEIVLTGIQLGSYGYDLKKRQMLCDIIERLSCIDGLERIRLSSIEPTDVTNELIEMIAQNDRVCSHLHIPLQSGNDEVLKRMNRRYRRDFFRGLIQNLDFQVPDFVLTTDVMIGFPGESLEQFENTVEILSETKPYKLHIFPYSAREGTRAAGFSDLIDPVEMNRRRDILLSLENELRTQIQRRYVSRRLNVLTEEGKCEDGWVNGRSANYLKVCFPGDRIAGINYQVEITNIKGADLIGHIANY